jgi:hypothetical protein
VTSDELGGGKSGKCEAALGRSRQSSVFGFQWGKGGPQWAVFGFPSLIPNAKSFLTIRFAGRDGRRGDRSLPNGKLRKVQMLWGLGIKTG